MQEAYTPESTCWGCGAFGLEHVAACCRHPPSLQRRCSGVQPQAVHVAKLRRAAPSESNAAVVPAMLTAVRLPARPLAAGPAASDGLFLQSYRIPGGLEATAVLDPKYCAFPGEAERSWRAGPAHAIPVQTSL